MTTLSLEDVERREREQRASQTSQAEADAPKIAATRFDLRDPKLIPRRKWLYGYTYIRRFISTKIAPGAVGKTSRTIVEALAMVTGRNLLGIQPRDVCRVWLWNGEDPIEETERRIAAACLHYGISNEDIGGRLFVDSGRVMPIQIVTFGERGLEVARPVSEGVAATMKANRIDVLIIDPFVRSHRAPENDNSAINMVAEEWASIAEITDSSIGLVHHSRKLGGNEASVESSRGGVSLTDASRSVEVFNRMTKDEAAQANVENHRQFFRVDTGDKSNMAPAADKADWYRILSVSLGNGTGGLLDDGDHVGVVVSWDWPNPFEDVTVQHLEEVQRRATEEAAYRADSQADDWIGKMVADVLGLDVEKVGDKARIKTLIKTWVQNKALVGFKAKGGRHDRPCLKRGPGQ